MEEGRIGRSLSPFPKRNNYIPFWSSAPHTEKERERCLNMWWCDGTRKVTQHPDVISELRSLPCWEPGLSKVCRHLPSSLTTCWELPQSFCWCICSTLGRRSSTGLQEQNCPPEGHSKHTISFPIAFEVSIQVKKKNESGCFSQSWVLDEVLMCTQYSTSQVLAT